MPSGHSGTLCWLLSLPTLRAVLGDFPKSHFYELEEDIALPLPLDLFQPLPLEWPSLEPVRMRELADAYFDKNSSHLPLLTRHYYEELQGGLLSRGLQRDLETAICLCVCALGCVASNPDTGDLASPAEELGLELFAIALRIIMANLALRFTPSVQFCQALMLAALYFDGLGRPLHAWKMTHYAGQQLLQLIHLYVAIVIRTRSFHALTKIQCEDRQNQGMSSTWMRIISASFGVALPKNGMRNATLLFLFKLILHSILSTFCLKYPIVSPSFLCITSHTSVYYVQFHHVILAADKY